MNRIVTARVWIASTCIAGSAAAQAATGTDFGDRVEHRLDTRGDRIESRLDNRGDRIDNRLDRRGARFNRHSSRRHGD